MNNTDYKWRKNSSLSIRQVQFSHYFRWICPSLLVVYVGGWALNLFDIAMVFPISFMHLYDACPLLTINYVSLFSKAAPFYLYVDNAAKHCLSLSRRHESDQLILYWKPRLANALVVWNLYATISFYMSHFFIQYSWQHVIIGILKLRTGNQAICTCFFCPIQVYIYMHLLLFVVFQNLRKLRKFSNLFVAFVIKIIELCWIVVLFPFDCCRHIGPSSVVPYRFAFYEVAATHTFWFQIE